MILVKKFGKPLTAFIALFATATLPAIELSDASRGMRCKFFDSGLRFQWLKPGGDWSDVNGKSYGDAPYAVATVARARRRTQVIEWDITSLARSWQQGTAPLGGVFLRRLAATERSSVKFHSREHKDPAVHPKLVIEWSDELVQTLQASADSTLTCSSTGHIGWKRSLAVGRIASTAIIFPFTPRFGVNVRRARLSMQSSKQYGPPSKIGVFRLETPLDMDARPQQGIAANFPHDEDIESHPAVVFAAGFESGNWEDAWSKSNKPRRVEPVNRDARNAFSPLLGDALKVTIPKGKKTGLNMHYRFKRQIGSEPEQMYFRYYLRLGDNWRPREGGKLPGFAGTYNVAGWGGRRSNGSNGWSARGKYTIAAPNEYGVGSYIYHADAPTRYGTSLGWNLGSGGVIEKNRWYSIEQFLKLNTPGESDGELKAWLDGVLVFDLKGLRFRDTDDLKIESLWMNLYHGGTIKAPADLSIYIDNVVIAHEYIGPAAGLSPAQ